MSVLERSRDARSRLSADVQRSLEDQGVDATWIPASTSVDADRGIDGHLRVRWDGGEHAFPAVVKTTARPGLVALAGRPPSDAILITEHVTAKLAESLERSGWQGYADVSGNVSLHAPGLLIRVTGRPPLRIVRPSTAVPFTKTGLPVTFALLVAHERGADWTQRDVARLSGSSLGTVNRAIHALRSSGHLGANGELRRAEQLAEQWTAAYLSAQPEAWPDESYSSVRWGAVLDLLDTELPEGVLIGSELAAFRHGASIRPTTALLHYPAECRQALLTIGRLRRDHDGPITLRPAPWAAELVQGATTAPYFLVRADLLLLDDPRLTEIAQDKGMTWNDWT